MLLSLLLLLTPLTLSAPTMPVIGILGLPAAISCDSLRATQPTDREFRRVSAAQVAQQSGIDIDSVGCFADYYVRFLQMGGARIVPLRPDGTVGNFTLDKVLPLLNGVLFTGGGLSFDAAPTFFSTARAIFDYATSDASEAPLALWGTCQGMQLLSALAADDTTVVVRPPFDSEDLAIPLNATDAMGTSAFAAGIPGADLASLLTLPITENLHQSGVLPASFAPGTRLGSYFTVLSTNNDRKGRTFVSTIESPRFRMFGVQFHPERPLEYSPALNINHSEAAVSAMQALASLFVRQAAATAANTVGPVLDAIAIDRLSPTYSGTGTYATYFF